MAAGYARDLDSSPRPFRGWWVVGGAFVVLCTTAGLCFYNLSVYLQSFIEARGFSVTAVSGATSVFFVASGISGLFIARLIERHDVRLVMVPGALLCAAIFSATSLVQTAWQLYAFYALLGVAYSATALVPCTTALTRWFVRRRTLALAFAFTGLSLGGITLTPLCVWVIGEIGIDMAGPVMGLIFLVGVVPPALILIRSRPEDLGQGPDGDPPRPAAVGDAAGVLFDEAVRSRFFIGMAITYILSMTAQVGGISHLFRLAATRSDDAHGAMAVAALAGTSVVGRLVAGWLMPKLSMQPFTIALIATQGLSLLLLCVADQGWSLVASAALFGATIGNIMMMQPLLIGQAFGARAYARIFAFAQLIMTLGAASGPALIGALYDHFGGYTVAYALAAGCSIVGAVVLAAAGRPARSF
ncbi:MFS transporter [Zavarzinia sp. CC-PAN008]|uniref:MFS transporter n=1 Tax=Zavarzinia sp. CC-PAN008 TaxID=3243332 RepID=UPI003F74739C